MNINLKNKKQMKVSEYLEMHVPLINKKKFICLIRDWDGSKSVLNAFYDISLLDMKRKESMEAYRYESAGYCKQKQNP